MIMRVVNHILTGVIFLNGAVAERPDGALDERTLAGPSLATLQAGLRTGDFGFGAWENRVAYGKARLGKALADFETGALAHALAIVAEAG